MLRVTKILEGGIDLTTQEQLPRSIVISNGRREVVIQVQEDTIGEIVEMLQDDLSRSETKESDASRGVAPPPKRPDPFMEQMVANIPVDRFKMPEPEVQVEQEQEVQDYDEPPPPAQQQQDDGFEPGEAYDDVGTGVSSL